MKTVKVRTTQNIELEYAVAGVGYRLIAAMVDWLLFLAIYLVLFTLFFSPLTSMGGTNFGRFLINTMGFIFGGLFIFYNLLCEILMNGQSIGKRMLKIKVVKLDGTQPTLSSYLLRWVLRIIDTTITFGGLAVVLIAFTENGQRVGDIAAGTTVISLRKQPEFTETIFEDFEEDYEVQYPEAHKLADKDIHLIKEILRDAKNTESNDIVFKLSQKLEESLGVKSKHPPKVFIKTILRDYNFINQ